VKPAADRPGDAGPRSKGADLAVGDTWRQIIKHAGIFGAGAVLFRLASVILLPVYTHFLRPTDYGVIAILDLTANILSIVVGGGIAAAATRAHYEAADPREQDRVWWTAGLMVTACATAVVGPAFVFRQALSDFTFGRTFANGSFYFGIALPTLWVGSLFNVVDGYFRAVKASAYVVGMSLVRLLVNVALNVTLLNLGFGVAGVLCGNFLSAILIVVLQGAAFMKARPVPGFSRPLARLYWRFGWPLVISGLLSVVMHEADRYVLRFFVGLGEVGLYSVAYQIGQGINTLVLMPFASIWGVLIYEIAGQPDAKLTYARVFRGYVFCLGLILLPASLLIGPALRLVAPPEYAPAAEIVPIVCLAYFFFSLHDHFKVPALLANRTVALLPVVGVAAATNVAVNLVAIPWLGAIGAAWVSVLTFIVFSLGGLYRYRRLDQYPYPIAESTAVLVGMTFTYVGFRLFVMPRVGVAGQVAVAAGVWLAWAAVLAARIAGPAIASLRARLPVAFPAFVRGVS